MSITYIKVGGSDVQRIVDKIEDVIEHEDNTHVSIACIVLAIVAQEPDIEPEQLVEAVKGVSEYLAAYLSPVEIVN